MINIAVCIKQVPDTTELRIDPETNTLIRQGVDAIMNPLDEFPLETALRLRDRAGGRVTVFTMGPPQAAEVLRQAIAFGADHGVLVSDRAFAGADTWATSLTLAAALRREGPFDLILCGKQAIDGDTAQVGPGIATHLDMPQVTYVTGVEWEAAPPNHLRVRRLLDNGAAVLDVPLPCLLTVLKEANEPRMPTLAGRVRATRFTPEPLGADDLGLDPADTGLKGSPTRVVRIRVPDIHRRNLRLEGPAAAPEVVRELQQRGLLAAAAPEPAPPAGK